MKKIIYLLAILCASQTAFSQENSEPSKNKAVRATQKVNSNTKKINDDTGQMSNETQQASSNVQGMANNVKAIVKVFEPITRIHLKKKANQNGGNENRNSESTEGQTSSSQDAAATDNSAQQNSSGYDNSGGYTATDGMSGGGEYVSTSPNYNADGTANLGSQNNKKYGCYIDILSGVIMDDIDAAGNSKSVDVIFTATGAFNEQLPMYAFLTPSYVKNDAFAYNFFKGTKYKDKNIPPASWDDVNESEVAMTTLSGEQFERIQNNNQLMAVVKQVRGFAQKVESRSKLDGKVLAVKTEMGERTAYGLIYIINHYGTIGDNGFLKIKIKVTGFDQNGDGNPDASLYQMN